METFGTLHTWSTWPRVHPPSRKVLAAARLAHLELTIPPAFEMGKTNRSPEFLAKFPLGKIPAFESGGEQGFTLSESGAIAYYIAESSPDRDARDRLVGATPEQRALIRQWLDFEALHVAPAVADLNSWRLGARAFDAATEAAAAADLRRWLDYVEAHLGGGRRWLVGTGDESGPSLADLVLGGTIFLGIRVYIDEEMRKQYPELMRWYLDLRAVPGLAELYPGRMVDVRKKPEPGASQ